MLQGCVGASPDQAARELTAAPLDVHFRRADRANAPVPDYREHPPGLSAAGVGHGPKLTVELAQRQKGGPCQGTRCVGSRQIGPIPRQRK